MFDDSEWPVLRGLLVKHGLIREGRAPRLVDGRPSCGLPSIFGSSCASSVPSIWTPRDRWMRSGSTSTRWIAAVQHATKAVVGRFNRREEERVGAALLIMEGDAHRRESNGEQLRDDGFFDARGALRPDAEELLEGVLRRSASTYEERKLPLLARLYSAVAHDQTISPSEGMYLVRVADNLTCRQFVALSVIAHADEHVRELAQVGAEHAVIGGPNADLTMLRELSDLVDVRLVGISSNGRVGPLNNVFDGLLPRGKTSYGQLGLLPAGERLVAATRADEIDVAERQAWLGDLRNDRNGQ